MPRISVPDMNCGHCTASVEAALTPLVSALTIDLPKREIITEGAPPEAVLAALEGIGFPAKLLG